MDSVEFYPLASTMNADDRAAILQRLAKDREQAIDALVADATREAEGEPQDRLYWTMIFDFEHAARVTQRSQLERIGYHFPSLEDAQQLYPEGMNVLDGAGRWYPNVVLIAALRELNVHVRNTDALDGETLYARLLHALEDVIPDLPPSDGVVEYIEMAPPAIRND